MSHALVNVPRTVRKDQVFEIKTLISHRMETGYRSGTNGTMIPRDIIRDFTCLYNDVEVFHLKLSPAIAANPFISFFTRATDSGTIVLRWTGDNGFSAEESVAIKVE
jgi:sulfur-oxidizing protein SoxZ